MEILTLQSKMMLKKQIQDEEKKKILEESLKLGSTLSGQLDYIYQN